MTTAFQQFDALAITDEIHEHILAEAASHKPIATLPGKWNELLLRNGSIRKVYDFFRLERRVLCGSWPRRLCLPDSYYEKVSLEYQKRGADELSFVRHTIENVGIAEVSASFFSDASATLNRFCFCKKYETLGEAGNRLRRIRVTL